MAARGRKKKEQTVEETKVENVEVVQTEETVSVAEEQAPVAAQPASEVWKEKGFKSPEAYQKYLRKFG